MSASSAVPLVSVVVPTYNNAAFIEETIQSILDQTFIDFELIVSDHSSSDGTWELVQPYARDSRVRLVQLPRTGQPHENWHNATARARGRYLKLVCGDDLLAPDCLAEQVQAMRSHPNAVMVAARRDVVAADGQPVLRSWGLPGMLGELEGRDAVRRAVRSGTNTFGEPACVLLCRETLDMVGGWDGSYPYVLDQNTYSKVLLHGTMVGLSTSLASFRLNDGQWSQALARQQFRQVVGFHRTFAERCPDVLTRGDRAQGLIRAQALTYARRLAYLSLARRLKAPVKPVSVSEHVPTAGIAAVGVLAD